MTERPERLRRGAPSRADLPDELTPETLRYVNFRTLRQFARPGNGVLDAAEQRAFDQALAELMRGTSSRFKESLQRLQHGGPADLDPKLRRSYQRTQQRLADQIGRARQSFPELDVETPNDPVTEPSPEPPATPGDDEDVDDVSPGSLEQEVEQTSDTLDMLERIASLQQQQVEHQASQLLSETRGLFFAFLVSVAVIVAGVAPLVEAEPHDRVLILLWTVAAVAVAGAVYLLVRAVQNKKEPTP